MTAVCILQDLVDCPVLYEVQLSCHDTLLLALFMNGFALYTDINSLNEYEL